ncbi:MAG: PH domain-containing protein [Patescibacteria group bacterium]|jgi:uncharacterized membrane protein
MINLDSLPNRIPNEAVVLFLRRHWIDLLRIFFFSGVLFILPVVVGVLIEFANPELLANMFWGPALAAALIAYLLVVLVLTCTELTDYWLDVWIVTSERIINAEQIGLFNRVVSEVYLYQVQDVTSETKGLLATFLTFGDVFIQTAAERERFQFKNIDNPDDVKVAVIGLSKTCKGTHHHERTEESKPIDD